MKDCTCRYITYDVDGKNEVHDRIEHCQRHAAVDDLIAALEAVLTKPGRISPTHYNLARAALARATGEAVT